MYYVGYGVSFKVHLFIVRRQLEIQHNKPTSVIYVKYLDVHSAHGLVKIIDRLLKLVVQKY